MEVRQLFTVSISNLDIPVVLPPSRHSQVRTETTSTESSFGTSTATVTDTRIVKPPFWKEALRHLFTRYENTEVRTLWKVLPFDWGLKLLISTGERYLSMYFADTGGLGSINPLNEAILLFWDAHGAAPSSAHAILALSRCLYVRFGHLNLPEDLKECLELICSLDPDNFALYRGFKLPQHLVLRNQALALGTHYRAFHNEIDLDRAVNLHTRSLELLEQNNDKVALELAVQQFHLSQMLLLRFRLRGDLNDLEKTQTLASSAQNYFITSKSKYENRLSFELVDRRKVDFALADCFGELYNSSSDIMYLEKNILLLQELSKVDFSTKKVFTALGEAAVTKRRYHLESRDFLMPCILHNLQLAISLVVRYQRTSRTADLVSGTSCLVTASAGLWTTPSQYLRQRGNNYQVVLGALHALSPLARCVPPDQVAYQRALLALCHICITLIPCVAYVSLGLFQRLDVLRLTEGAAIDASVIAVSSGRIDSSIRFLEQERAQLWIQHVRLYSEFTGLPASLAKKLKKATTELIATPVLPSKSQRRTAEMEEEEDSRRRLATRFYELVYEARRYPGHERFFGDRSFEELSHAAREGPVVILVAGHICFGIIITGPNKQPQRIFFEGVTKAKLVSMAQDLGVRQAEQLNHEYRNPYRLTDRLDLAEEDPEPTTLDDVLKALYQDIVQPILNALNLKRQEGRRRPRIWWCPTGAFGFLPLHAAGIYGTEQTESISDYVISSYTPTLEALLMARRGWQTIKRDVPRVLLIASPEVSGQSVLISAEREVNDAATMIPKHEDHLLGGVHKLGPDSTMHSAIEQLPLATVVHFACHGAQDPANPLNSAFLLGKDRLSVTQLAQMNLNQGYLAILNACETATGDVMHPDQSVHLAAVMLFMGFRSIAATMWTMRDDHGPRVAKAIYRTLFQDPKHFGHNPDDIPYAIDEIVRQFRDEGCESRDWATFMHFGI